MAISDARARVVFRESVEQQVEEYNMFVDKIMSDGASETLEWMGTVPGLIEYTGADDVRAVVKSIPEQTFTILNHRYEQGIALDDTPGRTRLNSSIERRVRELPFMITDKKNAIFWALWAAGESTTCYDGDALFSTSHNISDSGEFSNLISGTGVATLSQLGTDFDSAIQAMAKFKNDNGQTYYHQNVRNGLMVVCPIELERLLRQLFNSEMIDASNNPFYSPNITVYATPKLTDANDWYVVNTGRVNGMPFMMTVVQDRLFNIIAPKDQISSRVAHVYTDFGMAVGEPRSIVKIKNT